MDGGLGPQGSGCEPDDNDLVAQAIDRSNAFLSQSVTIGTNPSVDFSSPNMHGPEQFGPDLSLALETSVSMAVSTRGRSMQSVPPDWDQHLGCQLHAHRGVNLAGHMAGLVSGELRHQQWLAPLNPLNAMAHQDSGSAASLGVADVGNLARSDQSHHDSQSGEQFWQLLGDWLVAHGAPQFGLNYNAMGAYPSGPGSFQQATSPSSLATHNYDAMNEVAEDIFGIPLSPTAANISIPTQSYCFESPMQPNGWNAQALHQEFGRHVDSQTPSRVPAFSTALRTPRSALIPTPTSKALCFQPAAQPAKKKKTSHDKRTTWQLRQKGPDGGPCLPCKRTKGGCSLGPVCTGCEKRYHGLSYRICFRYEDSALECRAKGFLDIYYFCENSLDLPQVQPDSNTRELQLGYPLQFIQDKAVYCPSAPKLTLRVHPLNTAPKLGCATVLRAQEAKNHLKVAVRLASNLSESPRKVQAMLVLEQFLTLENAEMEYMIMPQSLPTRDDLLEWVRFQLKDIHTLFPDDVEVVLDTLLATYVDRSLQHRDLVQKVIDVSSLGRLLDKRCWVDHAKYTEMMPEVDITDPGTFTANTPDRPACPGSSSFSTLSDRTRISSIAGAQMIDHIVKFLRPAETEALRCIDEFVRRAKSSEGGDPLIPGLCIRRLMLHYRRVMRRYKVFGDALEPFRQPARSMYDWLTGHYVVVFKGTLNPFHKDWRMEEHTEALGNDTTLKELLGRLKYAEIYHSKNELWDPDDSVYKALFLEQKNKEQSCIAKQWSRNTGLQSKPPAASEVSHEFRLWTLEKAEQVFGDSHIDSQAPDGCLGESIGLLRIAAFRDSICTDISGLSVRCRLDVISWLIRSVEVREKGHWARWWKLLVLASRGVLICNKSTKSIGANVKS